MEAAPVFITKMIDEVVAATNTALRAKADSWLTINNRNLNYVYGTETQILQTLKILKDGTKYPMVAMSLGVGADCGNSSGLYGKTIIPAIYFATLSDNTRLPAAKYRDNFEPILEPIYQQFLWKLVQHKSYMGLANPYLVPHRPMEYPADNADKANTIFGDFLDIKAIYDLHFTIKQQPLISCANRIN
jgi:hypothetical protein